MDYTDYALPSGEKFSLCFDDKRVSRFPGLPLIDSAIRKTGVLVPFANALESFVSRKHCLYPTPHILRQLVLSNLAGCRTFQDAKLMRRDPLAKTTLKGVASPATLCRFFAALAKNCKLARSAQLAELGVESAEELNKRDPVRIRAQLTDVMNDLLLDNCLKLVKEKNPDQIIIDVDSTPVALYGGQENVAFDGNYDENCYLPLFVVVNGVAAMVQNAPGATNGAALLLLHIESLLDKVKKAFPNLPVIVRGDTGFGNQPLIEKIVSAECKYIIGCNNNGVVKAARNAVLAQIHEEYSPAPGVSTDIPAAVFEFFDLNFEALFLGQSKPEDRKFRLCGIVKDYKAGTWKTARTVAYRIVYNPDFEGNKAFNFRFIQSNMTPDEVMALTKGRGLEKGRSSPESSLMMDMKQARYAVELYESAFSDRGMDERLNCEWKGDFFASCCSLSDFDANTIRMQLSILCMQIGEKIRRIAFPKRPEPSGKKRHTNKPCKTRSHKAEPVWCGPLMRTIRKYLVCVPARLVQAKEAIRVCLPDIPKIFRNAFSQLIAFSCN